MALIVECLDSLLLRPRCLSERSTPYRLASLVAPVPCLETGPVIQSTHCAGISIKRQLGTMNRQEASREVVATNWKTAWDIQAPGA